MVRALIPGQRTRALTVLAACALILGLALATPVAAAGPLKLTAGAGDPGSAVAGSMFTFAVTYISKDDEPPAYVRVIIDGVAHDLSQIDASDSDMRDGARYRVKLKIKRPGTYAYSFVALDAKGREVSLGGGDIKVTPKPKPSPKPTPKPTPKPDQAPAPRATARPTPTDRTPTATPTTSLDDQATAGAALGAWLLDYDGGPWSDGGPGGPDGLGPGYAGFEPSLGSAAGGLPDPLGDGMPVGSDWGSDGSIGPRGSGAGEGAIAALAAGLPGIGSDEWLQLARRSAIIATGSAAIVAMALFAFRRRRREDEDPFDASSRETPPEESPSADAPREADVATTAGALTGEMAMPRWRRPSLTEARKADPGTNMEAIAAERLTFARGTVAGDPANERRRIRYRMVRLSDSPDEILGQEIGRLDEGDEVELLQRSGLHWQVRTPMGQVGWVHKMTLGDVVGASDPGPLEDDTDADGDVLAAFTEAQARRGLPPHGEPVMGEGLAARFMREHGVS